MPGICKLLQQCPSVYENLLKGLSSHKICGYLNFDPVVCCPDIKKISTTTIRTTTTKKTTAITTFLSFTAKMKTKASMYFIYMYNFLNSKFFQKFYVVIHYNNNFRMWRIQ